MGRAALIKGRRTSRFWSFKNEVLARIKPTLRFFFVKFYFFKKKLTEVPNTHSHRRDIDRGGPVKSCPSLL